MQGDKKVIAELNTALSGELTAIVQYMTQAEMCENWGYGRLAGLTKARAIEEMKHAEALIERLMFFDSMPEVNVTLKPLIGKTVQEQLTLALRDETGAVAEYNQAATVCTAQKDEGSKLLFERMLHDEERHVDFLEAQLSAIQEMGIGNYLSQQMKG